MGSYTCWKNLILCVRSSFRSKWGAWPTMSTGLKIMNIRVTGKLSGAGMFDKADPYVYFKIDTGSFLGPVKGKTTVLNNTPESPSWPDEVIELKKLGKTPWTLTLEC